LTPITSATELPASELLSKRQSSCAAGVYMIVARGSGEPQGPGRLSQVVQLIGQRIPNSVFTSVVYPANIVDFGAPAYPFSVREGIREVQRLIEARVNQCPNERIVLLGYSQGANACSTGLAGSGFGNPPLKEGLRKNIRGVALFGCPTQAANQSYNRGTATDGEGILGRTEVSLPQLNRYSNVLLQWCDRGDRVCAENIEPYDGAVHSNVVAKYATAAANHIANV
ncbi:carbohydrate esterase family 5 protein, partial [Cercospora zeae-maydis SCOH1-5]